MSNKKPRLTVSLNRFLLEVLLEESDRRKISLASVINEELAEKFATQIKFKEIQEKQKFT